MFESNTVNKKYFDQFEDETGQQSEQLASSGSCYESCLICLGDVFGCLRTWLPCCFCCCPYPYVQVEQYEVGLLENFGKYKKTLKPGFHKINPFTESIERIGTRTVV